MDVFNKYTRNICIKVENKKENYELQKALFKKGYKWGGVGKSTRFPRANAIFIYNRDKQLAYTSKNVEKVYRKKGDYTIFTVDEIAKELDLDINNYKEKIKKNYNI